MSDDTRRVKLATHVMCREVGGETVLLDLDDETYFGLGEVGTDLLGELEAGCTVAEAIDALQDRWRVDRETLVADVDELIGELIDAGLVEIDGPR